MKKDLIYKKNNIEKTAKENTEDKNFRITNTVENPIEKLNFKEEKFEEDKIEVKNHKFIYYSLVIVLIGFSMFLNACPTFFVDQIKSPYVVTIGEFKTFANAKEEAIKLLPTFKQIEIKQLMSGVYTFEMERFSSKDKAYSLANEFMQDGLNSVHVRYLRD